MLLGVFFFISKILYKVFAGISQKMVKEKSFPCSWFVTGKWGIESHSSRWELTDSGTSDFLMWYRKSDEADSSLIILKVCQLDWDTAEIIVKLLYFLSTLVIFHHYTRGQITNTHDLTFVFIFSDLWFFSTKLSKFRCMAYFSNKALKCFIR